MPNLVSLSDVKLALGITGVDSDDQLNFLISTASARIENWCNRSFGAADAVEWYDGGEAVTVKRSPIQRVLRVGYCDGSYLTATYTGADPQAFVQVTPTTMRLTSIAATYAATDTDIALADTTIDDLILAVAAVPGWSLVASINGVAGKAAWIAPCTGIDAIAGAPIPYAGTSLQVMRYEAASGVIKLVQSNGVFVPDASVNWDAYNYGGLSDAYGFLDANARVPKIFQGVVVDYRGGDEVIPLDIQQAAIDMVQYMFQQANNNGMLLASESLGGYSYSNASGGTGGISGLLSSLDELIRDRLSGYRRMALPI